MSTLLERTTKAASQVIRRNSPPVAGTGYAKRAHLNLFQVLNLLPHNGRGRRVAPVKWMEKGLPLTCYFEVTDATLKPSLLHGKAKGIKFWKGKQVEEGPHMIRGGLKWDWHLIQSD